MSGEDARNKGGSSLSRLAPSVTRVVICVSRAFCSTDQEKRETARSLSDFRRLVSRRLFLCYNESTNGRFSYFLAPVVPKLDSAIHRINLYSVDNAIGFPNAYLLGRNLSSGLNYPDSTSFPGSSPTLPPLATQPLHLHHDKLSLGTEPGLL